MAYTVIQKRYIDSVGGAAHQSAIDEIGKLENRLGEALEVLHRLSENNWVAEALSSEDSQKIAKEICALKREARAVLNDIENEAVVILPSKMWQPMNTVPHDGTLVDLFHKDGFRVTDQWWVDEDNCWSSVFEDKDFIAWMPVPGYPVFVV